MPSPIRVLILGAAGRDFHNFNVVYRNDPETEVVAFTAAQIPGIAGRRYPPELAGPRYPAGIPIEPEEALDALVREHAVDLVVFAYSDVSHEQVMHLASRALAAGCDFALLGPRRTMLRAARPVVAVTAVRTGCPASGTDPGSLAARSVGAGADSSHAEPGAERGRGERPGRLPRLAPPSAQPRGERHA